MYYLIYITETDGDMSCKSFTSERDVTKFIDDKEITDSYVVIEGGEVVEADWDTIK